MANLFAESEEIVFRKIRGDPIFDLYGDEGRIRDEGNDVEVKDVGSWRDEVLPQKILVEVNNLELDNPRFDDYGANWAFTEDGPTSAFTYHRNKEEHMDISFMMITLFTVQVEVDEICQHCLLDWQEYCHWMLRKRRNKLIEDHG
ncbi:hypothetical protein F2Q70_00001046 [Brassica cretica]|uniref:Uncharacterized protein n=1 Tax=Brassica cretica TaxID=69181 RepID=A0A8S9IXN7_BRACR|nr:hypothetical protein F2Q70_00001046 [Brassica cretica]